MEIHVFPGCEPQCQLRLCARYCEVWCSMTLHLRKVTQCALLVAAVALTGLTFGAKDAAASHTVGALRVYAPVAGSNWKVSSPSRFHDGCEPYTTSYYDSPNFDNGTCGPGVLGWDVDWSIDFAGGGVGANVYIDVQPGTIDGNFGLSTYRVVAGGIYQWDSSLNGKYQYFGIHVQTSGGSWENYAWIVLGHIDNFSYPTEDTIVAGPTTSRSTVVVAKMAPKGTWDPHVHQEFYNYAYVARSYNWDGPATDNDLSLDPSCNRGTTSMSDCNAVVYGTDVVGYVGGNKTSFAQVNNPYYADF